MYFDISSTSQSGERGTRITRIYVEFLTVNFVKLGMMDEAQKLSESLNGYLNIYKNHMMTALRALDFFNNISKGKNCNEQGCTTKD